MAWSPDEEDDILITPPGRIFVMTREDSKYHVMATDCTTGYYIGMVCFCLCGLNRTVVSVSNQALESEVCTTCLNL